MKRIKILLISDQVIWVVPLALSLSCAWRRKVRSSTNFKELFQKFLVLNFDFLYSEVGYSNVFTKFNRKGARLITASFSLCGKEVVVTVSVTLSYEYEWVLQNVLLSVIVRVHSYGCMRVVSKRICFHIFLHFCRVPKGIDQCKFVGRFKKVVYFSEKCFL